MNQKHCDEIYQTLQDMMSSEEDDDDDEEDLQEELNDRLDYIQNIVTDHDLYEMLSGINPLFIFQCKLIVQNFYRNFNSK